METAAVVLAAGGSTRLGRAKQFVPYRGESLLSRSVRAARAAGCQPVVVVAGDLARQARVALQHSGAMVVAHPSWQHGIGSSIRRGVQEALELAPETCRLLLMACDQPFVTAEVLRSLLDLHAGSGQRAAACHYAGTVGIPAVFHRDLCPQLLALPDDRGAKSLLAMIRDETVLLDFPGGSVDIDTPEDVCRYLYP